MKKIIYIAFAAAALAAVSCAKTAEVIETPAERETLSLRFFCDDLATRADGDTELQVNNEKIIKWIDYFFFPVQSDGTVAADTEYIPIEGAGHFVPSAEQGGLLGSYSVEIEPGVLAQIFPNGATQAMVFAIANYNGEAGEDGKTPLEKAKTWSELHALKVAATFFKNGGEGFGMRWPRPMATDDENLFFVMAGEKQITLKTSGSYAIDEEIPLNRLASKVTVHFNYAETVVEEKLDGSTITWVPEPKMKVKPNPQEARVYLSNALCNTTVGGPLTGTLVPDGAIDQAHKYVPRPDRDLFEYAYDFLHLMGDDPTAYYYTYPISMEEGDDNQPYLKLVLPWYGFKHYVDASETGPLYKKKEVYYKIVLPRETLTDPNCIYEFEVDVNIIGNDKDVKIIGEEYRVKSWLTRDPVSSNVAMGKYISLDIPKDTYDMYTDEIDIHFVSSGEVELQVLDLYQMNLSGNTPVKDQFMENNDVVANNTLRDKKNIARGDAGTAVIKSWATIPEGTSYLKINHAIDNRIKVKNDQNEDVYNTAFDMSPYVYVLNLHLVDAEDDKFDRKITITQYPSLYATSVKSNGSVYVNGQTYGDNDYANLSGGGRAYYMYNDNGRFSESNRIGSIGDPSRVNGSGTNNSQYSIIIHPTILDETLDLYIGEARESVGGPLSNIRGLTNYKPGRDDDAAAKVVSPGFMIASSYGKTTAIDKFDRAKERCASYQENGYPAGRWRVPTEGEIEFLIQLSDARFIPSLFNGRYYQSDGDYYESSQAGTDTNIYVRCVYDTWYWGEEPVLTGSDATQWKGFYDN